MKYYKRITVWESKRRLHQLARFRGLVIDYFNNSHVKFMEPERIEEPGAQDARVAINRMLDDVDEIIVASGVSSTLTWTPPATVGGYEQRINLVYNVFHLHRFRISPNSLLDFIDRSIGVYQSDLSHSLLRSINPIFYAGMIIEWIVGLPFAFLGRLGFDRERFESSVAGRAAKGLLQLMTALAALLTVLHFIDYLDAVKEFVRNLLGSE